jgi:hypothetical protein
MGCGSKISQQLKYPRAAPAPQRRRGALCLKKLEERKIK